MHIGLGGGAGKVELLLSKHMAPSRELVCPFKSVAKVWSIWPTDG